MLIFATICHALFDHSIIGDGKEASLPSQVCA